MQHSHHHDDSTVDHCTFVSCSAIRCKDIDAVCVCVWGNNCVNRNTCSCVIIISLYARNCFVLKKRVCDCLCKWKTVERERKSKLIICWKIVGFLEENWTSCTCWWTTPRFPFSHLWQVHLNTISEQKLSVSLILSFSSVLIVFSSSFSSSFSSLPLKNLVVTNLLFFSLTHLWGDFPSCYTSIFLSSNAQHRYDEQFPETIFYWLISLSFSRFFSLCVFLFNENHGRITDITFSSSTIDSTKKSSIRQVNSHFIRSIKTKKTHKSN